MGRFHGENMMDIFKPHKDSYALIIMLLTVIVTGAIASKVTTITIWAIVKFNLQHLVPKLGDYTWDIVFWTLYTLYSVIVVICMYYYFKPKKNTVDEPLFKYEGYPEGVVPPTIDTKVPDTVDEPPFKYEGCPEGVVPPIFDTQVPKIALVLSKLLTYEQLVIFKSKGDIRTAPGVILSDLLDLKCEQDETHFLNLRSVRFDTPFANEIGSKIIAFAIFNGDEVSLHTYSGPMPITVNGGDVILNFSQKLRKANSIRIAITEG